MNVALSFNLKHAPSLPSVAAASPLAPADARVSGTSAVIADAVDTYAEWDDEETVGAVAAALESAGHRITRIEADALLPERLRAARPDIVFNIAEGIGARSREAQVPAVCELFGIPHTGSDAVTLGICLDKAHTKEILSYYGIGTARFVVAVNADAITLPFSLPAFVKPVHEGSSKGIFASSVCRTMDDVRREVSRVIDVYHQPALIEEYLAGREFTVACLGNGDAVRALPIIEYNFHSLPDDAPRIDSFEAKWIYDRPDNPLDSLHCPADIPPALCSAIETMCLRAYHVLRICDWARIDVRLDAAGAPHIIEVNPLPGILPKIEDNSCFPKAARTAGISYDRLIQTVLELAAQRYGLSA